MCLVEGVYGLASLQSSSANAPNRLAVSICLIGCVVKEVKFKSMDLGQVASIDFVFVHLFSYSM